MSGRLRSAGTSTRRRRHQEPDEDAVQVQEEDHDDLGHRGDREVVHARQLDVMAGLGSQEER